MKFNIFQMNEYLISSTSLFGGTKEIYKFPNGFGASVIRHEHSYGGEEGLWELAVLGADDALCYTTEITDDVMGYLSESKVDDVLSQIFHLDNAE